MTTRRSKQVATVFWTHYCIGDWICSGGCDKGGDRFAKRLWQEYKIPYLEFPAQWDDPFIGEHNRQAGFERNTFIAYVSDILIACVAPNREGGTEDTIVKFEAMHGGFRPLVLV